MKPYKTELDRKHESDNARRKAETARKRSLATPAGQQFKAECDAFAAESRRAWMAIEHCKVTLKRTGALKLLIVASTDYCEPATGKDHDDMMAERRAFGTALDLLKPTALLTADAGCARMASIWAERRGVIHAKTAPGDKPDAAVSFGDGPWVADCVARLEREGVPVYAVRVT